MSTRLVRGVVFAVCVVGIGGMVAGSVADDNALAMAFGLTTAAAVTVLMVTTWVRTRARRPRGEEARGDGEGTGAGVHGGRTPRPGGRTFT